MPVAVVQLGCAPQQYHPSVALIANRVQRRSAPRDGEPNHAVLEVQIVRHSEHGEVAAEKSQERLLWTEDQPASDRVKPVGSDYEVKGSRAAMLERHFDVASVVMHGRNRVVKDIFHLAAGGFIDDLGEAAAHDLDVTFRDPLAERLGGDLGRE